MNVKSCFYQNLKITQNLLNKYLVMEVEDSVVNLPNTEIKEAAK
jgi:hypothetical protein